MLLDRGDRQDEQRAQRRVGERGQADARRAEDVVHEGQQDECGLEREDNGDPGVDGRVGEQPDLAVAAGQRAAAKEVDRLQEDRPGAASG